MIHAPNCPKPREGSLDAFSKSRPGQIRAFATRVSDQCGRIRGGQSGQSPFQSGGQIARDRSLFRGGGVVCALRGGCDRFFAPPAGAPPVCADLPGRDTQYPGKGIALRVELARSVEDAKQRLLSRVVGLLGGQTPPREPAKKGPQPVEKRVESRPLAAGERRQLLLERVAFARIHS
jgi:hypothetical protein